MTTSEIANLVLAIHGAVIPAAALAARNYGDRSEWLQKSLTGTDALLLRLRQTLADALSVGVASLPAPLPPVIVVPGGQSAPAPPILAGEAYRNCIHDFVRENTTTILSYSAVLRAKNGWAWWARKVSWATLLLFGYEVAAFAGLGVTTKFLNREVPAFVSTGTLIPLGLLVLIFISGFVGTARHHDAIMREREKHDPL